jgi:hypothetical protein
MHKGICVHCEREVISERENSSWSQFIYETRSGDEGGLYDFCAGVTSTNERHKLGVQA